MKRLVLIALLLAGCATTGYVQHGLTNFRNVDPGVYRGAQPTTEGWQYLRSIGISNVVKLNMDIEASDSTAVALGFTVRKFPIDTLHQTWFKPNAQTVSNAVAAITPGTFVHCQRGEDRTGLIIACYRLWTDKWTKPAARAEMLRDGFHTSLHGLDDFWGENVR